jgi:hypothetical protein
VDTLIVTPTLTTANLGQILSANAGRRFGVFADAVTSLSGATDAGGAFKITNRLAPEDILVGDFLIRIL